MSDAGTIVTVMGRVDPAELGYVLPHEHLFIDAVEAWFEPPESAHERRLAREPLSLDTLPYVRWNLESNRDNLRLDSMEEAIAEVERYRRAGGGTIVDVTPKGIGGDVERVRQVARATGVTFVHGTAYYTRASHPARLDGASADEIEEEFVSDVRAGIDDTDVRAGVVGEVGVSGRIHEAEERVLRAAARAARRTGAPLMVHPPGRTPHAQRGRTYPSSRWGLELLDVVEEEGIAPERVVVCHMDRTLFEEPDYQRELASRGAYVEFDLWGLSEYVDRYDDGYPSDGWRAETVAGLIDAGHADRLLFSHDVHMKVQRRAYGGFGYSHLLENVVPMLRSRGVERETIETILVDNPARWLAFDEPEE